MTDFREELIEAGMKASAQHERYEIRGGRFSEDLEGVECDCHQLFKTVAEHNRHKLTMILTAQEAFRQTVECPECGLDENGYPMLLEGSDCPNPRCIDGRVPLETRLAIVERQVGWFSPHASDPVNIGGMYDGKVDDDDLPVFLLAPDLPETEK